MDGVDKNETQISSAAKMKAPDIEDPYRPKKRDFLKSMDRSKHSRSSSSTVYPSIWTLNGAETRWAFKR